MARIRAIKPEFFLDEDLAELSVLDRLTFIGLWCHADREGRLEDRPKYLKAVLFPYDPDVDMEGILERLTNREKPFLNRYVVDNKGYIQIINFVKHQKPHHTEKKSEIPPPKNGYLTVKKPLLDREYPEGKEEGKEYGNNGKGGGKGRGSVRGKGNVTAPPEAGRTPDTVKEFTLKNGNIRHGEFQSIGEVLDGMGLNGSPPETPESKYPKGSVKSVDEEFIKAMEEKFPDINVRTEYEKWRDWLAAKGRRYKDYRASFRNWLKQPWVEKYDVWERARRGLI